VAARARFRGTHATQSSSIERPSVTTLGWAQKPLVRAETDLSGLVSPIATIGNRMEADGSCEGCGLWVYRHLGSP